VNTLKSEEYSKSDARYSRHLWTQSWVN